MRFYAKESDNVARILSDQDRDEYFSESKNRVAAIELIRNPFISSYLLKTQNIDNKSLEEFQFEIPEDELIPVNQDVLYNDKVSVANKVYEYSDKIRESSSIRYIKSSSEIVPEQYRKDLIENGADDDEFLIPFDYILVTRSNNSQFMIAEDFSNTNLPREIHKYSIIRYAGKKMPFKKDSIYSDGIDLSRVLTNDNKYIDVFANYFLSEIRLNESLMSTYGALDEQESDETDHGAGYVGYIDSSTLKIGSSMEKSELLMFERIVNGRRIQV